MLAHGHRRIAILGVRDATTSRRASEGCGVALASVVCFDKLASANAVVDQLSSCIADPSGLIPPEPSPFS